MARAVGWLLLGILPRFGRRIKPRRGHPARASPLPCACEEETPMHMENPIKAARESLGLTRAPFAPRTIT